MTQTPDNTPLTKDEMGDFERRVSKAKSLLILDHPFFGVGVSRRDIKYSYDIPTACMYPSGQMLLNPRWCQPHTVKNLMFLLAHEAMHYMLMHSTRRGHRDPKAWNVACVAFDTPVAMQDGTTKSAGFVVPGDVVATPFGGGFISDVAFTSKQNIVEVELHSGHKLICTSDHKILTQRGYVDAEQLREGEDSCAVDVEHGPVCKGPLPDHVCQRHGGAAGAGTPTGVLPTATTGGVERSNDAQADKPKGSLHNDGTADSVLSGGRGRGRHDKLPDEREPVSTLRLSEQHGPADVRVAGLPWDVRDVSGERERQIVLALGHQRLAGGGFATAVDTIPYGEEEAGGTGVVFDPAAKAAYQQLYPDHQHAEAVQDVKGVELREVKSVRCLAGPRVVVDLVSSQQCFYAQGIVVHNCDKVINDTLIDAKVGDFIEGGLHLRDGRNFASEELYDENDNGDGDGPGGTGNDVGPATDANGKPLDASEISQLEAQAKIEAIQCAKAAKSVGKLPGSIERMVQELVNVVTPWHEILERYMQARIKGGYSWARPNRRFVGAGTYLPGTDRLPNMGTVVCGVDMSGSVTDAELAFYSGHTNRILETCRPEKVIVAYFDHGVRHTEEFEPDDFPITFSAKAGGGTAFKPVFDHIDDEGLEPEVIVMLTDGYGDQGSFTTHHADKTIWLTTASEAFTWGKVIKFDME